MGKKVGRGCTMAVTNSWNADVPEETAVSGGNKQIAVQKTIRLSDEGGLVIRKGRCDVVLSSSPRTARGWTTLPTILGGGPQRFSGRVDQHAWGD